MQSIFQCYSVALLDSAFFCCSFSQNIKECLQNMKVIVSGTFEEEIEQYSRILPEQYKRYYEDNNTFLRTVVKKLGIVENIDNGLYNDTWGLISSISIKKTSSHGIFVITSNELLIQRIVLSDYCIDIYDLRKDCMFNSSMDFPELKKQYELKSYVFESLFTNNQKVNLGSTLYCKNGQTVSLEQILSDRSGEATLYVLRDQPKRVAKIFKDGDLLSKKLNHIRKIGDASKTLDIPWAVFPTDIIYCDSNCRIPAGFIETYVETTENLVNNCLYLADTYQFTDRDWNTRLSDSILLCIKIVRQVCYLNCFGFYICDFNKANFSLVSPEHNYIQMWDTDSFGYMDYYSGMADPDLKTSKDYDRTKKLGVLDYCSDLLHVFIFSLLSLDIAPISENTGKFVFDNPKFPYRWRKELIPDILWNYFCTIFRGEKLPSSEILLRQLSLAYMDLQKKPSEDRSYRELLYTYDPKLKHIPSLPQSPPQPPQEPPQPSPQEPPQEPQPPQLPWGVLVTVLLVLIVIGLYVWKPNTIFDIFTTQFNTGKSNIENVTERPVSPTALYIDVISSESDENYEYTIFSDGSASITRYKGSSTSIKIPSKYRDYEIRAIEALAFQGNAQIVAVTIPDKVKTIGTLSFNGCTSLQTIYIPDSVTMIGAKAFNYCSSLKEIYIPKSVISIGERLFEGCDEYLTIVVDIDSVALQYCIDNSLHYRFYGT